MHTPTTRTHTNTHAQNAQNAQNAAHLDEPRAGYEDALDHIEADVSDNGLQHLLEEALHRLAVPAPARVFAGDALFDLRTDHRHMPRDQTEVREASVHDQCGEVGLGAVCYIWCSIWCHIYIYKRLCIGTRMFRCIV